MPLGAGVRYRTKRTKSGAKIRLAFRGKHVVEAKNLASGATHTPAEFAADRKRHRRNDLLHGYRTQNTLMRGGPPDEGFSVVEQVPLGAVAPPFRHLGHFATGKPRTLREDRDVTPPPEDVPSQWREPTIPQLDRPGFRSRMPLIENIPPVRRGKLQRI